MSKTDDIFLMLKNNGKEECSKKNKQQYGRRIRWHRNWARILEDKRISMWVGGGVAVDKNDNDADDASDADVKC